MFSISHHDTSIHLFKIAYCGLRPIPFPPNPALPYPRHIFLKSILILLEPAFPLLFGTLILLFLNLSMFFLNIGNNLSNACGYENNIILIVSSLVS